MRGGGGGGAGPTAAFISGDPPPAAAEEVVVGQDDDELELGFCLGSKKQHWQPSPAPCRILTARDLQPGSLSPDSSVASSSPAPPSKRAKADAAPNATTSRGTSVHPRRNGLLHDLVRKREAKIDQAYKLIEELGVNSTTEPDLYRGYQRIVKSNGLLTAFIIADPEDRRFILAYASSDDSKADHREPDVESVAAGVAAFYAGENDYLRLVLEICLEDEDEDDDEAEDAIFTGLLKDDLKDQVILFFHGQDMKQCQGGHQLVPFTG